MPKSVSDRNRTLKPDKIVSTIDLLERRIGERFPKSGLREVARELHEISQESVVRAEKFGRPNILLRLVVGVCLIAVVGVLVRIAMMLRLNDELFELDQFIQSFEALLGTAFFLGAAIFSIVTIEGKIKRQRALQAIHELRALAHVVDMHQLTKDPERIADRGPRTPSSPNRTMTTFELGRYLDYCSELLSLISKIGAIYGQNFPDLAALQAVDTLSNLTNGLSRNIWQKIMILDQSIGETPPATSAKPAAPNNAPPTTEGKPPKAPGGATP